MFRYTFIGILFFSIPSVLAAFPCKGDHFIYKLDKRLQLTIQKNSENPIYINLNDLKYAEIEYNLWTDTYEEEAYQFAPNLWYHVPQAKKDICYGAFSVRLPNPNYIYNKIDVKSYFGFYYANNVLNKIGIHFIFWDIDWSGLNYVDFIKKIRSLNLEYSKYDSDGKSKGDKIFDVYFLLHQKRLRIRFRFDSYEGNILQDGAKSIEVYYLEKNK